MMSDLIKTLKQIALRKRDEKGEQGKRVSEKGFVEWKAADALEAKDKRVAELEAERDFAIDHRNTARDKVEELEADLKDYATAIGQNEQLRKENERQATLIRELNEHYGGQADEIERLTAVIAPDAKNIAR